MNIYYVVLQGDLLNKNIFWESYKMSEMLKNLETANDILARVEIPQHFNRILRTTFLGNSP
jgi:hypothetical protein